MSCRILVLTPECPLPANHGGRVDVARRLAALRSRNVAVMLVFWSHPSQRGAVDEIMPELQLLADEIVVLDTITVKEFLKRGARYPLWVGQREMTSSQAIEVATKANAFGAQAFLLDHLNAAAGLDALQALLPLPNAYRAHNIEFRYAEMQTANAKGLRGKFIGFLVKRGMKSLERRVRRDAKAVFDISLSDLEYWKEQGERSGVWLPVLFDGDAARCLIDEESWQPSFDVGYMGNLYAPNNVEGILWFIRCVIPELRRFKPKIKVCIAGSQPTAEVRNACTAAGVILNADPPESSIVLRDCRVLINPVFRSSGTNVKAIEMLFTPAALVSTDEGLTGLPSSARDCFSIARSVDDFASAVLSGNKTGDRISARGLFNSSAIESLLTEICG